MIEAFPDLQDRRYEFVKTCEFPAETPNWKIELEKRNPPTGLIITLPFPEYNLYLPDFL